MQNEFARELVTRKFSWNAGVNFKRAVDEVVTVSLMTKILELVTGSPSRIILHADMDCAGRITREGERCVVRFAPGIEQNDDTFLFVFLHELSHAKHEYAWLIDKANGATLHKFNRKIERGSPGYRNTPHEPTEQRCNEDAKRIMELMNANTHDDNLITKLSWFLITLREDASVWYSVP